MHGFLVFLLGALAADPSRADDYPKAELRNPSLSLTVYLPDARRGFYRGTRFDWAGVVGNVVFAGRHKLFGSWKDKHDPANYDDIVGPVEEFGMEAPLGYAEAKEGEAFLKIGVGALLKPREAKYRFYHNYQIKQPGAWDVTTGPTEVVFKQTLAGPPGYGYRYAKRITLDAVRPEFAIHHELTNTGTRLIDTNQYNHNFFNVDNDPVGPNYRLSFPAALKVTAPQERFRQLVAVQSGRHLVFTGPLDKGSVFATLGGLSGQTGPIVLTHTGSGVEVSVAGDASWEKVNVWGTTRTICPEPFIRIRLKPGESMTWSVRYTFGFAKP
jgi:hypothetical protein